MGDRMTVSRLAKAAGVNATAIRFYERSGIVKSTRARNGYRTFSIDDVMRVRFVRRAQALGFALREIRAMLAMSDGTMRISSAKMCALAEAKLVELAERRAEIARLERGISTLLRRGVDRDRPCPILYSLGGAR
ncbi:MAG TPA: MerR family transcriptional regulator [Kofleriaceae bacterium]|jgi:DNA-binding transcriptional MerR regulator